MKKALFAMAAVAAAASSFAQAGVRHVIEGRGTAQSLANVRALFGINCRREGEARPTGSFHVSWRADGTLTEIALQGNPTMVVTHENMGRVAGKGAVRVTTSNGVREYFGNLYVTVLDIRTPQHPDGNDKIRVRLIRNQWESPEGDRYFEGKVVDGDIIVKRVRI